MQLNHQYLFTLLGSARVKAVGRMLMKLSPAAPPPPLLANNEAESCYLHKKSSHHAQELEHAINQLWFPLNDPKHTFI